MSTKWYGDNLSEHPVVEAGEYLYIPARMPHLPYNPSQARPWWSAPTPISRNAWCCCRNWMPYMGDGFDGLCHDERRYRLSPTAS